MAGTVGGASYGIAKNVRLIAVRVLDNSGSGTYAQVIAGVDWVTGITPPTPPSPTCPWAGPPRPPWTRRCATPSPTAWSTASPPATTAPNASNYSPARVTEAITVGATDSNDGWASFSNYGSVLDILAPG